MSISAATVRLVTSSNIRATVNSSGGVIQSSAPVTLKTSSVTSSVGRLDTLVDVEEISPANGHTLVYRSSDDKYVVQQLSLENVSGALDGGSF
jgi:hypothetical protein